MAAALARPVYTVKGVRICFLAALPALRACAWRAAALVLSPSWPPPPVWPQLSQTSRWLLAPPPSRAGRVWVSRPASQPVLAPLQASAWRLVWPPSA